MGAIVVDAVTKAYGETVALEDVSVTVGDGEVFALVGPNGAGKTTLVRCVTGTTTPQSGQIAVFDVPPRRVEAGRVGYLPQDFSPPERLSARELIAYYAGLFEGARSVDGVLADVGVGAVADTWYEDLSGGERRRTLVGTVLVNTPDVLFLDEPTTGIDPAGRRAVWRVLESLVAQGTTVLLTTHDMDEATRLADRVGVLVDGSLVAVGAPGDLIDQYGGPNELVIETEGAVTLPDFEVTTIDAGVVVRGISPREIGAVVESLEANHVPYDGLMWRTPDLESVYLSLTGQVPRSATRDGRRGSP